MELDASCDWKTYAWVKRGARRRQVLEYLVTLDEPATATDVKKNQKMDIRHAAATLHELRSRGLVRCLNPEDHWGKHFVPTKKGRAVARRVKQPAQSRQGTAEHIS